MAYMCVKSSNRECDGCGKCSKSNYYTECEECGKPINDGDTFYNINFKTLCPDCMNDKYKNIAGE